jgi:phosphoglycerate dehydrogenase-like enzyme
MALLLALAKHLLFHDGRAREGCFSQLEAQGTDLRGKRALVLGYGHIGRRIGALCGAFGMEVTAMNRTGTSDADRTITPSGLLGALREADAVMVALAHTPSTDHQLGEEELACLKDTAMLVNVARGPVIDQGALYRRLASTPTLRAGLDVWWNYPRKGTPWRQEYHFEKLPNVLMTPHVAGLGETWRSDMMETAARNVLRFLQGEKIENRVDVDAYLM